jgi:hypothetical protein
MPLTYDPISTTTLGSTSSTINFNSIPSTYTDLRLVINAISSTSVPTVYIKYNSNSSGYSRTVLAANGSSVSNGSISGQSYINVPIASGLTTTNPQLITADIFSYAGSRFKTALLTISGNNGASGSLERVVACWDNTTAITSINLSTSTAAFGIGTRATLYGIKAA